MNAEKDNAMDATNPYQTPEGNLQQEDALQADVKVFSPRGRIGRLRYLAYLTALTLVTYAVVAIPLIMMVGSDGSEGVSVIFSLVNAVVSIAGAVLGIIWAIKRLHDLDKTGWLALLMIVPLANFIMMLILLFAPGTPSINRFGPPPVPNTTGVKVLACLFPVLLLVIAILMGVFISFMGGMQ
ncbi:DUF805 domain-containing protein [Halomonadaceae bacterium KBTZ08]